MESESNPNNEEPVIELSEADELIEAMKLATSFEAWVIPDIDEACLKHNILSFCRQYKFTLTQQKLEELISDLKWEIQKFKANFMEYYRLMENNEITKFARKRFKKDNNKSKLEATEEKVKKFLSQADSSIKEISQKELKFIEKANTTMKGLQLFLLSSESFAFHRLQEIKSAELGIEFFSIENKNFFPTQQVLMDSFINIFKYTNYIKNSSKLYLDAIESRRGRLPKKLLNNYVKSMATLFTKYFERIKNNIDVKTGKHKSKFFIFCKVCLEKELYRYTKTRSIEKSKEIDNEINYLLNTYLIGAVEAFIKNLKTSEKLSVEIAY